jgi:hypothetical protein
MAYRVFETSKGLSNLLRIFRSQMTALGVVRGSRIAFVGCSGTCLPFVELFAYTLRNDQVIMTFIPDGIVDDTRSVWHVPGIGMQCGGADDPKGADFIVLLGGLSMPNCTLGIEGSNDVINKIKKPSAKVVGICFMSMFEKAGWYGKVPFDLVIDAAIDPINVQKFE